MLADVYRQKVVGYARLCSHFGLPNVRGSVADPNCRSRTSQRLTPLARNGYLAKARYYDSLSEQLRDGWYITQRGLNVLKRHRYQTIERVTPPSPAYFEHSIRTAEMMDAVVAEGGGGWLTERELPKIKAFNRRINWRPDAAWAPPTAGSEPVAYELDLGHYNSGTIREKLAGFNNQSTFQEMVWVVPDDRRAHQVRRLVANARISKSQSVQVRSLRDIGVSPPNVESAA